MRNWLSATENEPVRWVIDRGMAKLCIALTFLAGFFVGAAVVTWIVLA